MPMTEATFLSMYDWRRLYMLYCVKVFVSRQRSAVSSSAFATAPTRSRYFSLNSGVLGRFSSRSVARYASETGLSSIFSTRSATCSGSFTAPLTSVNGVL